MSDLLTLGRKAAHARLGSLRHSAHRMTEFELQLMDRLLDEYARKSRAHHKELREQREANTDA